MKNRKNVTRSANLTSIRCIIPWLDFFKYCDPKVKRQKTEDLIKEIESKKNYALPFKYLHEKIEVSIRINSDQEFNKKFPSQLILNHYPKKSLILEFKVKNTIINKERGSEVILMPGGYSHIMRFVLETFLLACNIAYTGSLYIATNIEGQIIMEIENKKYTESYHGGKISGSIFQEILGLSNRIKWTSLEDLSLEKVWLWLTNFNDIFTGFGDSQIGKIINALKYVTVYPDDFSSMVVHMVWLIVALEALYLKGIEWEASKNKEIKKRVKSYLDKEKEIDILSDEKLGAIYSFRSNFFHGSLSLPAPTIPLTFDLYRENPQMKKFYSELNNTTIILGLIIISTLKKMVTDNWTRLDFKTEYRPMNT